MTQINEWPIWALAVLAVASWGLLALHIFVQSGPRGPQ